MKEIRTQAAVDITRCSGCGTCIHVCPTMARSRQAQRPIERHKLPPCIAKCPIGNDIEGFLTLLQQDKWDDALSLLMSTNPLPGVTGRVCNSPCEAACNRGSFDQSLSIRALERALADYAASRRRDLDTFHPRYKERIAVIGSGPAGLSCAYHLVRAGFRVAVFEQMAQVGGILRYGIPKYRLPADVLDREVELLQRIGIDFKVKRGLNENLRMKDLQKYDAVFLATGLHAYRKLGIPGEDCPQVMPGLSFLEQVSKGKAPEIGRRVLVIGGGNSAVDSARTALRLGAKPTLVYRRTEHDMPAIAGEIEELKAEGIEIRTLTAPVRFMLKNGRPAAVECIRMESGAMDAGGRRRPVPVEGSEFTIAAETVIHCIGETGDLHWAPPQLTVEGERIVADQWGRTSMEKIFAGGDVAGGLGTVAGAIGAGRRSALTIASYLQGETAPTKVPELAIVAPSEMNFDYLDPALRLTSPRLSVKRAMSCFDEIHRGARKKDYLSESDRCLHCGVSPEFDEEYCRGCSNCTSRCPTYALSLVELENPYVVKVDVEDMMTEEICRICEKAILHPESIICQCTGTRADEIVAAILKGARTVIDIRRMTGAHTGCGSACISPIFRLMKAAGLEITDPLLPDLYYPSVPEIWDIPDEVIRDFESRGFRFREDKGYFNDWLVNIRDYCKEKTKR